MPASGRHLTILALAAGLFSAIFGLRLAVDNPVEAIGYLYILPIALIAVELGRWPGIAAAAGALGLVVLWDLINDVGVGLGGYLTRGLAMGATGALIGELAARQRGLEDQTNRWFDMSNALLAVASPNGYLTRLNSAWERCLGFSREQLMSQPFLDLVHPDDVAATVAATVGLRDGTAVVVDFENRYRTKDGDWRWLLWAAQSDGHQIYAVATDISDRKQLELERDALLVRLEAIARTDALTGLPNRRAWDEELRREVARATRHGHPLCVVMLDIDHFKAYNDTHGHPAGDALLKDVAVAWRQTLRVTDLIARYGGEEFAAVLPDVSPDEAATGIVERLLRAVPAQQTCSAGVAMWDGAETPETLLERADRALYEAKRTGRNRTTIAP